MIEIAQAADLASILEARGDPMAGTKAPWMKGLRKVPKDAAAPLAMSGRHPRAVGSYGPELIEWAKASYGVTPRWWQALAITRQLEHDADGVLVWREILESGPRRIGKSTRLRLTACWRCANAERFLETQLAMLVSKDLAVGKEIHRGSWRWAESQKPAWNVLRLGGAQEIEAPDGSRWLLRAPNAAYGYDVGYGQVDESWDVDPMAITDGLEPALLERHSPQLHLTSTAHVRASSLMRRRLIAALRNADPDVLLLLWGPPPGADLADEKTWRLASPHWTKARRDLIARKYGAALAGQEEPEFDDPDPVRGWAAQYLNVWPLLLSGATDDLVMPNWPHCATSREHPPVTRLGISVDLDRVWVSVGAFATDGNRRHLGAVLRRRLDKDRAFVVSEVKRIQDERGCTVALDRKGPERRESLDSLEKELVAAGVTVTPLGLDEYLAACDDVFDAVSAKEIEHGDYPELNDAVKAAGWRKVGPKRRAWAAKGGDVSMLEAVTLAFGAPDADTFNIW